MTSSINSSQGITTASFLRSQNAKPVQAVNKNPEVLKRLESEKSDKGARVDTVQISAKGKQAMLDVQNGVTADTKPVTDGGLTQANNLASANGIDETTAKATGAAEAAARETSPVLSALTEPQMRKLVTQNVITRTQMDSEISSRKQDGVKQNSNDIQKGRAIAAYMQSSAPPANTQVQAAILNSVA